MRQYMIDELSPDDARRLEDYLREEAVPSEVDGLYWVELGEPLLEKDQEEARQDQPFRFAIEVGDTWAKFELLVRSRENMRSPCTRYAGPEQQEYIIGFAETAIRRLGLMT